MKNKIENRRDMIEKAIIDCLDEMYRNSQPSITWKEIEEQAKANPNRSIWQEHYLPKHLYDRIQEKYMQIYRIGNEWNSNIELLEDYLINGGTKDKYIDAHTDEYGYHPGYRDYEKVPAIKEQIEKILNEELASGELSPFVKVLHIKSALRDKIVKSVMNTISDCKEFYVFNREENNFRFNVSNYSPNSNIEAVREFYKDTDIVINEISEDIEELYDED